MELTPEERDAITVAKNTTVITANWSIRTTEQASVCVNDLDMFVTVQLSSRMMSWKTLRTT